MSTESRQLVSSGVDDLLSPESRAPSAVWIGGYLLVVAAIWSLVGRYKGIIHDAVVYLLQAAAKLLPDPLASDVFLRYQSQDSFTVFPNFYALALEQMGADRAAASLTFACLVCWFALAWAIARKLQNSKLALLSLALLLLLPGYYGAREVFRYAEPFLTARLVAEVVALAALLSLLHSKRVLAAGFIVLALLIHPLMAFPVGLLMVLYVLPLCSWRAWIFAWIVIVAGAILGSIALSFPDWLLQHDWLEVTRQRSAFLFTDRWGPADWEVQSLVLLTLLLGTAALPSGVARKTMASALCVGFAGLTLAILSSSLVEVKILLQGQPWRWLWIGRLFATALLPVVVIGLWRRGVAGQSSAMLLAAAWLISGVGSFREVPPIGVGGLLTLLALLIWSTRKSITKDSAGIVKALTLVALALVGAFFVSLVLVSSGNRFSFGHDPVWIQRVHDVIGVPGIAASVATFAWASIVARRSRVAILTLAIAAGSLLYGAAPEFVRRWTVTYYDAQDRDQFAHWRRIIPRESEVFWPGPPQAVWLLLDRRSYMSISQGAGSVFSERTTAELQRRAQVLSPLVPAGFWFLDPNALKEDRRKLTLEIMRSICVDPSLGFVVSSDRIPGAIASAQWPSSADVLNLYDCSAFR
jgi:hypothetical protein